MPDSTNPLQPSWHEVPNILTQGLPAYSKLDDLAEAMAFHPFRGIDMLTLPLLERQSLLLGEKMPLEPNSQSLKAASTWLGMLQMGLKVRNPALAEARRHYWAAIQAGHSGDARLLSVPTKGCSVNVTKGPTGTGKSATQARFCALLPPFIDRAPDPATGLVQVRQLIYLVLDLPHDGSRGGVVASVLLQMDEVLGTNYAASVLKQFRTVDKQCVAMIARLRAHFTGILFLEEGQLRNLILSAQAEVTQMLLLQLMNSGIPIVIIGNERAFDWIEYSQDLSRLNITPQNVFSPIGAFDEPGADDEWDAVSEGVMGCYALTGRITNPDDCKHVLYARSGGVARSAMILWTLTQMNSMLSGRETVGPEDIEAAYNSRDFDDLRPMSDGFHYRRPELLMKYPDIDVRLYCRRWGFPIPEMAEPTSSNESKSAGDTPQALPRRKKKRTERSKFQAEKTKNANLDKKRSELENSLDPDDIRKQGLIAFHLASLETALATAKQDRPV